MRMLIGVGILACVLVTGCEMPNPFSGSGGGGSRPKQAEGQSGPNLTGGIYDRSVHGGKLSQEEENRLIGANMHNQLGMEAFSNGDYEIAIERFQLAIRQAPDYIDAINNLGRAYYETGKFGAALTAYEHALALTEAIEPGNVTVLASIHANIGDVHRQRKEYTQAVAEYMEVQRLAPNTPRVYYELGNLYLKQGKMADAVAKFSRTLELDARFDKARLGRAIAYNLAGRYQEAYQDIAQLEQLGYDVNPGLKRAVVEKLKESREAARFRPGS